MSTTTTTTPVLCEVTRAEALGYSRAAGDPLLAALGAIPVEALDALAAEAGYDTSDAAWERNDGAALWRWDVLTDECELERGHAGPHWFPGVNG